MPENAGYNPDEVKAQAALEQAKKLIDEEEAAKAEAELTGAQNLEIPEGEIDDLFGNLEKGDGEEK